MTLPFGESVAECAFFLIFRVANCDGEVSSLGRKSLACPKQNEPRLEGNAVAKSKAGDEVVTVDRRRGSRREKVVAEPAPVKAWCPSVARSSAVDKSIRPHVNALILGMKSSSCRHWMPTSELPDECSRLAVKFSKSFAAWDILDQTAWKNRLLFRTTLSNEFGESLANSVTRFVSLRLRRVGRVSDRGGRSGRLRKDFRRPQASGRNYWRISVTSKRLPCWRIPLRASRSTSLANSVTRINLVHLDRSLHRRSSDQLEQRRWLQASS